MQQVYPGRPVGAKGLQGQAFDLPNVQISSSALHSFAGHAASARALGVGGFGSYMEAHAQGFPEEMVLEHTSRLPRETSGQSQGDQRFHSAGSRVDTEWLEQGNPAGERTCR